MVGSDEVGSLFASKHLGRVLACVVVALAFAGALQAQQHRAKASFLRSFGHFVKWPVQSLPDGSPLIIGFVGQDDLGGLVETAVRGKSARGHAIQFRHLSRSDELRQCHILFISVSEAAHLPEILNGLGTASVLTVSDLRQFALHGGMIELAAVGDHLQFDINWRTALDAGLTINSEMLDAAREIYVKRAAGGR